MTDITQNLQNGDLSVLAQRRHYGFNVVQAPNLVKYHVKHNDEAGDDDARELNRVGGIAENMLRTEIEGVTYFSQTVPFYVVLNPYLRGALGAAHDTGQGIALFASGPLDGCSVAVLKKGNTVLFVHGGADAGTSGGRVFDPDGVNNDLFRIVLKHEGLRNNNRNLYVTRNIAEQPLNSRELAGIFRAMGYAGIIFHPAERSRLQAYDEISVQEYNARLRSDIFAVTTAVCHVMLIDCDTGDADQYRIG